MPDESHVYLASILSRARTLAQAEEGLAAIAGMTRPRAWGLFDGYSGRPKCVPGVLKGCTPAEVVRHYDDGYRLGQRLGLAAKCSTREQQ